MNNPSNKFDSSGQPFTDQFFIDAVLAGDTYKFDILMTTYRNQIYRFILKNMNNTAVAEDLTQETFLEAYRNLNTFKGNSKFPTWLRGIALNIVRNYLNRSPDRRYNLISSDALLDNASDIGNPLRALEKKGTLLALKKAIDNLPPDLRETFILISLEGVSYDEAAKILEIPIGTVKSRVCKARDLLRKNMGRHGDSRGYSI